MIRFTVNGQELNCESCICADGCHNYPEASFSFDNDWEKYGSRVIKTAYFSQNGISYAVLIGNDGKCVIPNELVCGNVEVAVHGEVAEENIRIKTVPCVLYLRSSALSGETREPVPPTPDLYTQLIGQFEEMIPENLSDLYNDCGFVTGEGLCEAIDDEISGFFHTSENTLDFFDFFTVTKNTDEGKMIFSPKDVPGESYVFDTDGTAITGLPDPSAATDAANRRYVDNRLPLLPDGKYSVSGTLSEASGTAAFALGTDNRANANYSLVFGTSSGTGVTDEDKKECVANYLNTGADKKIRIDGGGTYYDMKLKNPSYTGGLPEFTPTGPGGTYLPEDIDLSLMTGAYDDFFVKYGNNSVASGYKATSIGQSSTALGNYNGAFGHCSAAIGYYNNAYSHTAIAIGKNNQAGYWLDETSGHVDYGTGTSAVAIGRSNNAFASDCVAIGHNLKIEASNRVGTIALGHFNARKPVAFEFGIGTSESDRRNAVEIAQNGDFVANGKVYADGTKELATKEYAKSAGGYDTIISSQAEWDSMVRKPGWSGAKRVLVTCDIESDQTPYLVPFDVIEVNFCGCGAFSLCLEALGKTAITGVYGSGYCCFKKFDIVCGCRDIYTVHDCGTILSTTAHELFDCRYVFSDSCSADDYTGSSFVATTEYVDEKITELRQELTS